jgi:hypothetical protein
MDLSPSCPEAGLRQVFPDGLPTLRFTAGNADIEQYERSDIVKRAQDACASRRDRVHLDGLKNEFSHRMQTPPGGFCANVKERRITFRNKKAAPGTTPSDLFDDCRVSPVLPLPSTGARREGSACKEKPAGGVTGWLPSVT